MKFVAVSQITSYTSLFRKAKPKNISREWNSEEVKVYREKVMERGRKDGHFLNRENDCRERKKREERRERD